MAYFTALLQRLFGGLMKTMKNLFGIADKLAEVQNTKQQC
jgi:hypothetical protein